MNKEIIDTFYPASRKKWRQWLQKHHGKKQCIWLVYYKKSSGRPTISWSEAVDEALCFGWIDSTKKTVDNDSYIQFFCPRKPKSVWSKINKEKIERLSAEGLMAPAGNKSVELAKQNGSWGLLDGLEEMAIPKDLEKEFKVHRGAKKFFLDLSPSARKSMLQWLMVAKRAETRQKRVKELAELAAKKQKPKPFV